MKKYSLGCTLKIPAEKRKLLNKKLSRKSSRIRHLGDPRILAVLDRSYLFDPGRTLTVAFKGGGYSLQYDIARWAKEWELHANIKFDFGHDSEKQKFRSWSRKNKKKKADIRISFESNEVNNGYWSAIGNDIDFVDDNGEAFYPAHEPTMNYADLRSRKPDKQRAFVLHEFGHALGFMHEHQSPSGDCDKEFRWEDDKGYNPNFNETDGYLPDDQGRNPGIFTVMENPPYSWTREAVEENMKMFKDENAYEQSKFDKYSIMKYYYEPWMYKKGEASPCYSKEENMELSLHDKKAAQSAYPFQSAAVKDIAVKKKIDLQTLLNARKLTKPEKAVVNETIAEHERNHAHLLK